ncbi:MAG: RNA pseudouridine synthase, partial [Gammaproteobacteria bacterium]|nr:RNA pseudouridine synthase [Gammaproteobacteria bacterium]
MSISTTRIISHTVAVAETATACEMLAVRTGFSKGKIKDAMNKGAVWLVPPAGPMKRLRRATATLNAGEKIELHYNDEVLAKAVPSSVLVADEHDYSVWFKPSGVLAQGTMEGDHCALLRQAELHFKMQRPVFLVHRLDREASGLMLVAHSQNAAARLSALFQNNAVYKRYWVQVRGQPTAAQGGIDAPLDGKTAHTEYTVESYDAVSDTSILSIVIDTGRLHQIRRHLDGVGHP